MALLGHPEEAARNGLAWCVIIAKQRFNSGGEFLGDPLEKHSSSLNSLGGHAYIEELIALVYSPGKEFHDFPPSEVTLAQETTGKHGHQLDSMIFFGILIRCRPGVFQASREEHYEDWLLQEVENETHPYTQDQSTPSDLQSPQTFSLGK